MPYYSELGIYTPTSSAGAGAGVGGLLKGPYSNHSSILASNLVLAPPPSAPGRALRPFQPLLSTISEARSRSPLRRINSPKGLLYRGTPVVPVDNRLRPIKHLNTADIDVSANRYGRASAAQPKPQEHQPHPEHPKDATPTSDIRRDRATVRLKTVHKDNADKVRTWRDNFEPHELQSNEAKVRKKSPGEILKEKFLIRSRSKENFLQADEKKISRRKSAVRKSPSFHDICTAISSDSVFEDLNPAQTDANAPRKNSTTEILQQEILDHISKVQEQEEQKLASAKKKNLYSSRKITPKNLVEAEQKATDHSPPPIKRRQSVKTRARPKALITGSVGSIEERAKPNLKVHVEEIHVSESPKPKKERKFTFSVVVEEARKESLKRKCAKTPAPQRPLLTTVSPTKMAAQLGKVLDKKDKPPPKLKIEQKLEIPKVDTDESHLAVNKLEDAPKQTDQNKPDVAKTQHAIVDKSKQSLENGLSATQIKNGASTILGKSKPAPESNIPQPQQNTNMGFLQNKERTLKDVVPKSQQTPKLQNDSKTNSLEKNEINFAAVLLEKKKPLLENHNILSKSQSNPKITNIARTESTEKSSSLKLNNSKKIVEENQSQNLNKTQSNPKLTKISSFEKSDPKKVDSQEKNEQTVVLNKSNLVTKLMSSPKSGSLEKLNEKGKISSNSRIIDKKEEISKIANTNKLSLDNTFKNKLNTNLDKSVSDPKIVSKVESVPKSTSLEKLGNVTSKSSSSSSIVDVKDENSKTGSSKKSSLNDKLKTKLNTSVEKSNSDPKILSKQSEENVTRNAIEKPTKTSECEPEKCVGNTSETPEMEERMKEGAESEDVNFWASLEGEKERLPQVGKLRLESKEPRALLQEIESTAKVVSKRSLMKKANKDDPDLEGVFEPPEPPPPKEHPGSPGFVPLQSNRFSQWMHPWKKPKQEDACSLELFARPKVIKARHIPRRYRAQEEEQQQNSDDDETSDSDSDEDDTSQDSDDETQSGSLGSAGSGPASAAAEAVKNRLDAQSLAEDAAEEGGGAGLQQRPAPAATGKYAESSTYGAFRRTGRVTPPATTIPRFRKYCVDDFNFLKVLGKGNFGKVLLAELKGTDYYYAIKCLKKDVVLEDDDIECTLIERKVLALGTKHPYLCHLLCTFQTNSHLFFVMEYLNGGDLMFHIQNTRRFSEDRARFYAAEILSGLKFLHNKGIVYRDLKLDNILLDFDGHARIADFGMCKLQIFLDRMADTFCGTPDYMAPEIIKGQHYNQCVDWWSFGVLLYEMLIGSSPFSGCDEDELFWSICNEKPVVPKFLSKEAHTVLVQLMEKDANNRLGNRFSPYGEIQEHVFFRPIDWHALEERRLEPPFKPDLKHPLDTQYFDKIFTKEPARLTPIESRILSSMDQTQFHGFSYTNPNATDV